MEFNKPKKMLYSKYKVSVGLYEPIISMLISRVPHLHSP